ncbi:hypothetical protein QBC34DRAFT_472276 [Podospora aff. communis PSN243]|uniref:Berberine/berberine-like domain-containing protein n=1 Tax=Podospora aff. communis PSN243 TaxID=3040156 RepID=A0AAV9GAC0_9PEZI|nr:hypothetical protein QBC34DRAFT_472276 [Podospora aff. communis PSN243]
MAGISNDALKAAKARLDGHMDALRKATPGGGAYFNEGDGQERGWQEVFFGGSYRRLVGVKKEWDPRGVFWAATTPGSEGWGVEGVEEGGGSDAGWEVVSGLMGWVLAEAAKACETGAASG